jgi:hypothetical protein
MTSNPLKFAYLAAVLYFADSAPGNGAPQSVKVTIDEVRVFDQLQGTVMAFSLSNDSNSRIEFQSGLRGELVGKVFRTASAKEVSGSWNSGFSWVELQSGKTVKGVVEVMGALSKKELGTFELRTTVRVKKRTVIVRLMCSDTVVFRRVAGLPSHSEIWKDLTNKGTEK